MIRLSDYRYDPTHKNKPVGPFWRPTKRGWSNIPLQTKTTGQKYFTKEDVGVLESRMEEIKIYGGFAQLREVKDHEWYKESTRGNLQAARKVIESNIQDFYTNYCSEIGDAEILLPIWTGEPDSNMLPIAFAEKIASYTRSPIRKNVFLTDKADNIHPVEKMIREAKIRGKIEPDKKYVIVSDHEHMGWSIDSVHNYIIKNGGISEKAVVLTKSHYVLRSKKTNVIALYPGSSELEKVSDIIGGALDGSDIMLEELTRPMLVYLMQQYNSGKLVDTVRDRVRIYKKRNK